MRWGDMLARALRCEEAGTQVGGQTEWRKVKVGWDFLKGLLWAVKAGLVMGVSFQIQVLWAGLGSAGRTVSLDMLDLK